MLPCFVWVASPGASKRLVSSDDVLDFVFLLLDGDSVSLPNQETCFFRELVALLFWCLTAGIFGREVRL
jgi:hypothetical protein